MASLIKVRVIMIMCVIITCAKDVIMTIDYKSDYYKDEWGQ